MHGRRLVESGMRTAVTLDTDTLPPEEARKLQEMVDAANFFNPCNAATPASITVGVCKEVRYSEEPILRGKYQTGLGSPNSDVKGDAWIFNLWKSMLK